MPSLDIPLMKKDFFKLIGMIHMIDMGMGESQGNRFICKGLEHRKYLTFLYTGIDKKGLILSFHQIHGASHLVVNGP